MNKIEEWAKNNIVLNSECSAICGKIDFNKNKKIGILDYRPFFKEVLKNDITEIYDFWGGVQNGASAFCLIVASYYISQGMNILYIADRKTNQDTVCFAKTIARPFLKGVSGIEIDDSMAKQKATKIRFTNEASLTIAKDFNQNMATRYQVVIGDRRGDIEQMKYISSIYAKTRKIIKT